MRDCQTSCHRISENVGVTRIYGGFEPLNSCQLASGATGPDLNQARIKLMKILFSNIGGHFISHGRVRRENETESSSHSDCHYLIARSKPRLHSLRILAKIKMASVCSVFEMREKQTYVGAERDS
ncbi:hypothetical protein CEXT_76061 [Caerostris extrusa]|uniref:Uncharacterized protein n=1 Tax=Caerostris extrusa TaxID=172846 RepID=A0AAV4QU38_CAEEX|nr:hypothetical protein CEXT_76061 [Caerostris extrusa]